MKLLELPKGTFSEKILFIGEPGSGKTSLINSYRNNSITSRYSPTIGVEISNALLKLNDQCIIDLNLWDMGRILKSAVNSLTRCYSGADLVLICVDMTRKQDFDLIDNKFEEIRFKISPSIPIIIVATKSDLPNLVISERQLEEKAESLNAEYFITSNVIQMNIFALFEYCGLKFIETSYGKK